MPDVLQTLLLGYGIASAAACTAVLFLGWRRATWRDR